MMAGTIGATAGRAPATKASASVPPPVVVRAGDPCEDCNAPITDTFYIRNGDAICVPCHGKLEGSFGNALGLGLGASVLSIAIFYAIYALANHLRFVFIAVIAGVMIGSAVRRGARASNQVRYRWLAVVLTYVTVVATYAQALSEMPGVTNTMEAVLRSFYLPFLMLIGHKNLVTLILLGFGLHEAWKFSAPPYLHVEGPFEVERTSAT
jgi:hypothetical protein